MVFTAKLKLEENGSTFTGIPINLKFVTLEDAMKWQNEFPGATVNMVEFKTYTDEEWELVVKDIWK